MQKFIVTNAGEFRYGDVMMHRDLLKAGEDCIGGGMYEFDWVNMTMRLSGRSYDFGRVKWGWLDELLLPAQREGVTVYYEDLPLSDFVKVSYKH